MNRICNTYGKILPTVTALRNCSSNTVFGFLQKEIVSRILAFSVLFFLSLDMADNYVRGIYASLKYRLQEAKIIQKTPNAKESMLFYFKAGRDLKNVIINNPLLPFKLFYNPDYRRFIQAEWPPKGMEDLSAVTQEFTGGRFGDNILPYMITKYMAYKYKVPFLYKPFEFSDQLMIHENEEHLYSPEAQAKFKKVVWYSNEPSELDDLKNGQIQKSTLYCFALYNASAMDWDDQEFKKYIRNFVKLKKSVSLNCPKDRISVALHVRRGGNFKGDTDEIKKQMPTKFPPDNFYVNALKKVIELYKNKPLYVHIFTDDPNPKTIVDKYTQELPVDANLQFNYRKTNNSHDNNVLEDFSLMSQLDVLIRSDTSFGSGASIIGDHKVIIYPKQWIDMANPEHRARAIVKDGQVQVEFSVHDKRPLGEQ